MNDRYFIHERGDGTVVFGGIQTGRMTIHHRDRDVIVLKEEGSKFWSGIGQPQSYAPAKFRVMQVIEHNMVEQITSFPVRAS